MSSNKQLSSPSSSMYPLGIDGSNRRQIQRALEVISQNIQSAKDAWVDIRTELARNTQTYQHLHFSSADSIFAPFAKGNENLLEAVLVVSLKYNWKPEEVLALWQIEGLPAWISHEKKSSTKWLPIKDWYIGKSPKDEDEARSWARSIILFTRWGLDYLTPVELAEKDNRLRIVSGEQHDKKFNEGYKRELSSILAENPINYLSEKNSETVPIELEQFGNEWHFKTRAEYQATMLAMQHATFHYRKAAIPPEVENVCLKPPFASLGYIFYNSKNPHSILRMLIKILRQKKQQPDDDSGKYTVDDLYDIFLTSKIPENVRSYIEKNCPAKGNCHSYVNALRFEFLLNVYSIVFNNVIVAQAEGNQVPIMFQALLDSADRETILLTIKDFYILETFMRQQINEIRLELNDIANRSPVFTGYIDSMGSAAIAQLNRILYEAHQFISDAKIAIGAEKRKKLQDASSRFMACLILVQVLYLSIKYLQVASIAEEGGQPRLGYFGYEGILVDNATRMRPLAEAALSFDRERMIEVLTRESNTMQQAVDRLNQWVASIRHGAERSRKVISKADNLMMAFSLVQAARGIYLLMKGPGATGAPLIFRPIVNVGGGAATAVPILIPNVEAIAEVAESIGRLIAIGALDRRVVSFGLGPTLTLPQTAGAMEILYRKIDNQTMVPSAGPYRGKPVTYGDPRGKHTKVADLSLSEILQELKNYVKSKFSWIRGFGRAIATGDKKFGSQLSKEAADEFGTLVKDGLEKGVQKSNGFFYKAAKEIGIDVMTGKPTPYYRIYGEQNSFHIVPVSPKDPQQLPTFIKKMLDRLPTDSLSLAPKS